jgi:hypothetical protein
MHPARIAPFLRVNRVPWKTESPSPRKNKCSEKCPKVPTAPPKTRNRKQQETPPDETHEARLAHPSRCLGLQEDVAQSR